MSLSVALNCDSAASQSRDTPRIDSQITGALLPNAPILKGMTSTPSPLRLFPTEAAAKKAGLALADFRGERLSTVLYALLPEDEKKPTYLLSSSSRLTVAEKRWVEEHRATVTKLGSFHPGRNFAPLQTNMVRKQKPAEQEW